MDFCIIGSNDWKDDEFSVSLHKQLFGNASMNFDLSVNTTSGKKKKLKGKLHELTHCDNAKDVHLPADKNDSTKVTETTVGESITTKKQKKKKKKKKNKDLSNSLASEEKSILSNDEKQGTNKLKLQYKQVGDHMKNGGTEKKELIVSAGSPSEVIKMVHNNEEIISKSDKTSKCKRKHSEEFSDSISNKRQKQKEKQSSVSDSEGFSSVKTHHLPVEKNYSTEVTEATVDKSITPKNLKKKKKKKKNKGLLNSLSNSLASEERSNLSSNEKQDTNKSKLLEPDGDHIRSAGNEKKELIVSTESPSEIIKKVSNNEEIISESNKTSKRKKRKRKRTEEFSDFIFNKRQKQEEKESSVLDLKGFGSVKTHQLSPSKLQHILKKYDTPTKEGVQKTDNQNSASSILKERAMKRLEAAKFRFLNEKMYTVSGNEALMYFQNDPEAFEDYHSGYQLQVKKWPVNPVDLIISDIQKKPKSHVIVDLGCGDAKIARVFPDREVHSFDLVPLSYKVLPCDMSKVPISDESVDIAVFCLSLMGTNLADYILESHRILKDGGLLKIAEVESRIKDLDAFIASIGKYGFSLASKDTKHKMFVLLDFYRVPRKVKKSKLPPIQLDPCIYKKR